MADYYPLIARAVATARDAPPEVRAEIYERARGALMKHLRAATPALSPDKIAAEEIALDDAIAQVEAEITGEPIPAALDSAPPAPPSNEGDASEASTEPSEPEAPKRPQAPLKRPSENSAGQGLQQRWRLLAAGLVFIFVAVGMGVLAIANRDDPDRYRPNVAAAPDPATPAAGPKMGERMSGDSPEPAAPSPAPAPAAPPPRNPQVAVQSPPPSAPATPVVAIAQRAILYEERPEAPTEPTVVTGRAVWRLDLAPPAQGQPADTVIKVDLEFPERQMGVEITIHRNVDPALPASHLLLVKFAFRAGGGPVKALASPPTMKVEENQRGAPLVGLIEPVMENYFLIGLSNAPADIERNLSQLTAANWIDLPFRFANDRIGVIAIEKGSQGVEAIRQALERWKN